MASNGTETLCEEQGREGRGLNLQQDYGQVELALSNKGALGGCALQV